MSEAQHTPGPWSYSWETENRDWAIVTDATGLIVANVNTQTGPDIQSAPAMRQMPGEANARLIAAAPKMLAALERAKAALEMYGLDDFDSTTKEELEAIDVAIAAAKGGAQ